MKLLKVYLLILYQSLELLINTRSDHVEIISYAKEPRDLSNLNKQLLEIIRENLETSNQPCENFWNYSCGSWTSAPYYDHMDNFGAMANYYADNLIDILKELQTHDIEIAKLLKQLMAYFKACRTSKVWNLKYYLQALPAERIFGESFQSFGDHLFQENIWHDFEWLKAAALLRQYGFKDIFLQESAGFARRDSQQYVVQFKIPHAKISFHNKYQVLQIMEKFDFIFGLNVPKNYEYLKLADQVAKFDNQLQNLYEIYHNGKENYEIRLQDLPILCRRIDWYLYFQLLLNQALPDETVIEFTGSFDYFKELESLFQETTKSVQGTYMLLKFCLYLMEIRPTITERECLLHTNVMFPVGVDYIYNRYLYKNRIEDEAVLQFIFSRLKKEFDKIIRENKFDLDMVTVQQLREKLKRTQLKIGNLPPILNATNINLYYGHILLTDYDFYHNHLEMLKFRTWQQHQFLFRPSLNAFSLDSFYVNDDIAQLRNAPYFVHKRNMIIVPLVFLQLPFYHYALHPVLQFSLVGWILAHELSHAFDTHGIAYDGWGNENAAAAKLSTKTSFNLAVQCLVAHTPAVSVNERMADVNGLQLAYQAFFHDVPKQRDFLLLKKLFFINFSQFFCGTLPRAIGHDRDDVRVQQSIANMEEFGVVFQCSTTAKENPQHQCNIWKR